MNLNRILPLIPFINSVEPISKTKLFKEYAEFSFLSFSSFNNIVFELKAFHILETTENRGELSINKKAVLNYLKKCELNYDFAKNKYKSTHEGWWKKWEKILKELLA